MRTYGRVPDPLNPGQLKWVQVNPDSSGHNDYIWLTTLIQNLKLQPNESPFYADHGIPAQQSVIQQIFPDLYVSILQQQFAQYFASLIITRLPTTGLNGAPIYRVNVITNAGVRLTETIAT